jgi:diguanylate cyclase (GGDEF)-like protein
MLIRRKITLALIVTNLAVIATVGAVAYHTLHQKFNEQVAQAALSNFRSDATSFIETYGSWEAGVAKEPFEAFVARRARQTHRPIIQGLDQAAGPEEPPGSLPTAPGELPAIAESDPASPEPSLNRPPFRFMIFSPAGVVLKAIPPYRVGDSIGEADRASALPIERSGNVLAYVVAKGDTVYSSLDLGYIAAIRHALWLGVGAGLVLALAMGWLLGSQLSSRLRRLTSAVDAVHAGHFDQQVEVGCGDEVGDLAKAFNQMSGELQRGREALKASYGRIEKQAEVLRELSTRDSLTHLHNRRYFDEQIAAIDRNDGSDSAGTAVMLGDVDFFKQINDRFSHATGDSVLRQVGEILRKKTRRTDIVARYGGEEFVVAFTGITLEQAQVLCEKLRKAIENHPWHRIEDGMQVTMSFGLTLMTSDITPAEALASADRQLYRAKSEGRNRVCVASGVGATADLPA